MKTYFHIENKEFTDYFKITATEKEYYFRKDLTIEYTDAGSLDFDIELIKAEDYLKIKAKNPFFKLLLNIARWIISPLMYFIDNESGIGLDKGYHSFNPFTLKQSFSINCPDEKTVNIGYVDSQYDKATKKYSAPSIKLQDDGIIQKAEKTAFSATALKGEWNAYHLPAFTVIMVVILLLNWLNFSIFAKVMKEFPLYSTSEYVGGIIGMSFCSLIMIGLLVAHIVIIVKSRKLYKKVLQINL